MMAASCEISTELPALKLLAHGKVRDVYEVDCKSLLFVATDRLSAFDVVMKSGIPGKGKVLTQLSLYWFEMFKDICPNHVITANIDEMPDKVKQYREQIAGRSMLVKKLTMLPVEAIVRGYITGSGWKEYSTKGTVCGMTLPKGLQDCSKLDTPLYTPSTKAADGMHDELIHPDEAAKMIGAQLNAQVAETAIKVYLAARKYAASRGIIIADTKFEFGLDRDGQLVLADEVLTPDSSRFWPAADYAPGRPQDSYDKQFVRDYLESIQFDKKNPVALPDEVVQRTYQKYLEIYEILTGSPLQ